MTDSRKRALYLLFSCVLACAATFLNGLFKPELHWQVRLLESSGENYRIEGIGEQTSSLFQKPLITTYSEEGYRCLRAGDTIFVQNKLLQDKLTLENWVNLNNGFASWVMVLAVFQVIGYIFYLLQQKLSCGYMIAFIFLAAIVVIALVTVSGPLTSGPHFSCASKMKAEAELMSISLDVILFPFSGAFLNVLAVIMMVKFYRLPKLTEQTEQ